MQAPNHKRGYCSHLRVLLLPKSPWHPRFDASSSGSELSPTCPPRRVEVTALAGEASVNQRRRQSRNHRPPDLQVLGTFLPGARPPGFHHELNLPESCFLSVTLSALARPDQTRQKPKHRLRATHGTNPSSSARCARPSGARPRPPNLPSSRACAELPPRVLMGPHGKATGLPGHLEVTALPLFRN